MVWSVQSAWMVSASRFRQCVLWFSCSLIPRGQGGEYCPPGQALEDREWMCRCTAGTFPCASIRKRQPWLAPAEFLRFASGHWTNFYLLRWNIDCDICYCIWGVYPRFLHCDLDFSSMLRRLERTAEAPKSASALGITTKYTLQQGMDRLFPLHACR